MTIMVNRVTIVVTRDNRGKHNDNRGKQSDNRGKDIDYSGKGEDDHGTESDNHGTVECYLESLWILAKNSENAQKMVNCGILADCEELLVQQFSQNEVKSCLKLILSLSLEEKLKPDLVRRNIVEKISKWSSHENSEIKECVKVIKWNLGRDDLGVNPKLSHSAGSTKHVMISYCHKQKDLAHTIWKKLEKINVKIWIDKEQMRGNMYDKMAQAVQNASHVICCVSEDYFNSDNCKSEIQYAKRLKRKLVFVKVQKGYEPADWLDLLMAGEIYYEMSEDKEIEANFDELLKCLPN